ncbi:hypothetical protein LEN26_018052 [Aphanomyces euteiches]|nr:hypothetical protein LEN26_018052 [Aphanomyces euteiches]KAH9122222.1 hypothetical protein AeMF1_006390 [Aphanomyces euteiches]KAH9182353.1 hypothetical protein AeNC1_015670 [Aphanomyces euteiches]
MELKVSARVVCHECLRPPKVCFCDFVPRPQIATRFRIHCVQHPNEAKRRALSSVPLLEKALSNFTLEVSSDPSQLPVTGKKLLLFPGPSAELLSAADLSPELMLVVVDGTWKEAKKIVQHSAVLRELPRVIIQCDQASLYGVLRKEPMEGCVSTLEAVAQAITILEGQDASQQRLLQSFRQLVAAQQAYMEAGIQRNLVYYNGVPKPSQHIQTALVSLPFKCNGERKWYQFYRIDRTLTQESTTYHGEPTLCTYTEAVARCAEINQGLTRGHRFAVRPIDASQELQK